MVEQSLPPCSLFLALAPSLAVEDPAPVVQPLLSHLLELAKCNPTLRFHLLFGGTVIDWFKAERPHSLKELAQLHRLGQIHLLHGVLYAPRLDEGRFEEHLRQAELYRAFWEELSLPVDGLCLDRFRWEENLPTLATTLGATFVVAAGERDGIRRYDNTNLALLAAAPVTPGERSGAELLCFTADEQTKKEQLTTVLTPRPERFFTTVSLQLAQGAREAGAFLPPPYPTAPLFAGERAAVSARINELRSELDEVRSVSTHLPPDDPLLHRLTLAERHLLRAQAGEPGLCTDEHRYPALHQQVCDSIVRAQVEIDAVRRPDVDPNLGWVRLVEREERPHCIDTQLMRLWLNETGGITSFEYKPRKVDLVACLEPLRPSGEVRLVKAPRSELELEHLFQQFPSLQNGESRVTKQTPGILGLRVTTEHQRGAVVKELTVRAGIGAHLNNATTGFSIEYWLEPKQPLLADEVVCMEFHLLLPSASQTDLFLKPLQCVGGVSSLLLPTDPPSLVTAETVPGGVYGLRFHDAPQQFLLDIRSAKQLSSVGLVPTPTRGGGVRGLSLFLFAEARRLIGDERSNTVFVSIE